MTNNERKLIYKLAEFVIMEKRSEAAEIEVEPEEASELRALLDTVKAEAHG
jgi:hypothetical protein